MKFKINYGYFNENEDNVPLLTYFEGSIIELKDLLDLQILHKKTLDKKKADPIQSKTNSQKGGWLF